MATRAEFLGRIRAEVAKTPGRFEAQTATRPPRPAEAAQAVRRQMAERWPEALERFRQEFEQVAGVFHRVKTVAEVPAAVLAVVLPALFSRRGAGTATSSGPEKSRSTN